MMSQLDFAKLDIYDFLVKKCNIFSQKVDSMFMDHKVFTEASETCFAVSKLLSVSKGIASIMKYWHSDNDFFSTFQILD